MKEEKYTKRERTNKKVFLRPVYNNTDDVSNIGIGIIRILLTPVDAKVRDEKFKILR